jgi:hypothetical protein
MPRAIEILRNKDWLSQKYIEEKLSAKEISKILKCSFRTVLHALHRFGIPIHGPQSKYQLLHNKEWLVDTYINKKNSTEFIAKITGSTSGNVSYALKMFGIEARSLSDAQILADRKGVLSGNWKGGRIKNFNGYVAIRLPDHPNAMPNGYILEHRLVMEGKLGRYLESHEIVHHIDGNKTNNSPDNLAVLGREQHKMTHKNTIKRLAYLEERLRLYEEKYGILKSD